MLHQDSVWKKNYSLIIWIGVNNSSIIILSPTNMHPFCHQMACCLNWENFKQTNLDELECASLQMSRFAIVCCSILMYLYRLFNSCREQSRTTAPPRIILGPTSAAGGILCAGAFSRTPQTKQIVLPSTSYDALRGNSEQSMRNRSPAISQPLVSCILCSIVCCIPV